MGTLLAQEIPEDRILLYCHALNDISESALCFAFERGLRAMGEFLPSVQQLRGWSEEWQRPEVEAKTREILRRDPKPTDWAGIGRRNGIDPVLIQEWLNAGKEAQNEHIAKLEDDPEWRKMAERLGGFPGFVKREIVTMAPEERKAWATKHAQDTGWL